MNLNYLNLVARNHVKLLLRSWLFWLFFLFAFGCILYVQSWCQSDLFKDVILKTGPIRSRWVTLPSFIPYMNAYLFTIFQVIPLIFLACNFFDRGRKTDSLDAIHYRPHSNTEYIWGMCWGFTRVFWGTAMVSLFLAVLLHLFASAAPFDIWIYLFYLFTLILPAIIFILGLSFFIASRIRNQALSLILLLGYLFITYFYVGDIKQGIFDPLGITLPNAFSEITGHPDLTVYLFQRGCWLFLGLGFIQLTVVNFRRLFNDPSKQAKRVGIMMAFMIMGLSLGLRAFFINQEHLSLRELYSKTYDKYAPVPKGTLVRENIEYHQQGDQMTVNCDLEIQNQTSEELREIILYLNPALRVGTLSCQGINLPFEREQQVIRVQKSLLPEQSMNIRISYEGGINEDVCYLDVPEEIVSETKSTSFMTCRRGKHYAFLEKHFTLLIPEVLWYPVTVPPVNPKSPYDIPKNFTHYTLQVFNPEKKTVISQGKSGLHGESVVFRNRHALDGISLCMGEYETRSTVEDSTRYELHLLKKHIRLLDDLKWLNNKSILSGLLSDSREKVKSETGRDYPYDHFILVETPLAFASYVRNERGGSEFLQPEIVFLPEGGDAFWRVCKQRSAKDLYRVIWNTLTRDEVEERSFGWLQASLSRTPFSTPFEKNPYNISSLLFNRVISYQSDRFPIMDAIVNLMIRDNCSSPTDKVRPMDNIIECRAIDYLSRNNLESAISDRTLEPDVLNGILMLKSREITSYFNAEGISMNHFHSFIVHYLDEHRFNRVDFSRLNEDFIKEFGKDWMDLLPFWYNKIELPRYLIKDFSVQCIATESGVGSSSVRVEFSIFNDSEVDGIVNLQSSEMSPEPGNFSIRQDHEESFSVDTSYRLKAGSGKKIALVFHKSPTFYTLNTNISGNLPHRVTKTWNRMRNLTQDTSRYIQTIDRSYFLSKPDEIIVDNEDKGFHVSQSSSRFNIIDYFRKRATPESTYENLTQKMVVNDKWKPFINNNAHGESVRSAMIRLAGKGESSLEWNANLPREGRYELFIHVPYAPFPQMRMNIDRGPNIEKIQRYIVSSGKDETEVLIDINGKKGWLSLGKFNRVPGECKVSLSDRGTGGMDQVIIGDAVKWVYWGK